MIPHVWFGVSIESRDHVTRADILRLCPVDVKFISAEPLIGPLLPDAPYMIDGQHNRWPVGDAPVNAWRPWADEYAGPGLNLEGIDWLIIGGESGHGSRPMDPQWARELVQACEDVWQESEGETFPFMKQMGSVWAHQHHEKGKGENPDTFPWELRVRKYPAGLPAEELLTGPPVRDTLF
jgi:protein gp37